jgi:putative oxidoreductase
MKKIFHVAESSNAVDITLLFIRVAIAALMLVHGIPKMAMLFSDSAVLFPSVAGLSPAVSLSLTVFAEVFCSVLILTGFATRLAVIPLIITMLVAVFVIHAADPFTNKELGLHYLVAYIGLLLAGSGKYSLDYLLRPTVRTVRYQPKAEDPTLSIYQ